MFLIVGMQVTGTSIFPLRSGPPTGGAFVTPWLIAEVFKRVDCFAVRTADNRAIQGIEWIRSNENLIVHADPKALRAFPSVGHGDPFRAKMCRIM